ncbi:BglII/BstYI family type II restriction endonuclease, partial [Pacificimonas flava]|uniref:BglII/BstYI family type II restriction endonuclease n=1 Tax=Pacificimonas flava TaxID=1234595 RepID=UPI00056F7037
MSTLHLIPTDLLDLYHVNEWRNATGILQTACPEEWSDILAVLRGFTLLKSEVITKGGRKSPIANRIDSHFYNLGWQEKRFNTAISVDDREYESPTHSVDCFKGRVGVEVEWNNKDPFYDRDLNNFRLLFDLRVIDVGIIITRASELQAVFKKL